MHKFLKRLLPYILLFGTIPCWSNDYPLNVDGKEAMNVGIFITDISTGNVIKEYQSEKVFTPASILKSITSATACSLLPMDFQFETPVYITGTITDGILNGDIVVCATGDATIESSHFSNKGFCDSIVVALSQLGIKKIMGSCIVSHSGYWADEGAIPQWEVEDVAWSYGTGLYAFNYKDNIFRLSLPQKTTMPSIDSLIVKNSTIYGDDDPILVRGVNSYLLSIYGSVPQNAKYSLTCSTPFPSDVFLGELLKKLEDAGIGINSENNGHSSNSATEQKRLVYLHKSQPLKNILHSLMVRSDNLFAESILRAIAPGKSRSDAIKEELDTWESRGIDCAYISILDGSGLSRSNKFSPKTMGNILSWMAKSKYGNDYVELFPICGKEGTVKSLLNGTRLEGSLALKSGSMNGVLCYAGYKLDKKGTPTHAIVIMVNNFFCKSAELKKSIEQYLLHTF